MIRLRRAAALLLCAAAPAAPVAPAAAQRAAEAPPAIRREFRGVWVASVSNIDWPSRPGLSSWQQQAELRAILDRAVQLNLNVVLLQVRPSADALYESPYEPWSSYLTGVEGRAPEPYYDPLRFAVAEAHARGLELHAWFNPYRARHYSATGPHARTHVSVVHPELVRTYGRYEWMDPGEPAVIAQTLRVMLDVVKRYDVDGIHIDDYFYPYPELGPDSATVPFPDSSSYARYTRGGGRLALDDWRRHNVDTLMQQIYVRTKALKPWVKVGISPFGIWRPGNPPSVKGFDSWAKLYGDSRKWLREGWADYFSPQLYWPIARTDQSYTALLDWWVGQNVKHRDIVPGHNSNRATTDAWPADELNAQIRYSRHAGATGDILFSMRSLMPPRAIPRDTVLVGVATRAPSEAAAAARTSHLRDDVYAEPALVPPTPWLSSRRPPAPRASVSDDPASGDRVLQFAPEVTGRAAWRTVRVRAGDEWRTWILPASQRRLVIASAAESRPLRVVVTAVDRFGTESVLSQITAEGRETRQR